MSPQVRRVLLIAGAVWGGVGLYLITWCLIIGVFALAAGLHAWEVAHP